MAMTDEQGMTLLSRVSGGEAVKVVLTDLGISRPDFVAWRSDHAVELRNAKRAGGSQGFTPKEMRLAELNRNKDMLQRRLAIIDSDIVKVEAE